MFYLQEQQPGIFDIMREDVCVGYFNKNSRGYGMELTEWLTVGEVIAVWTVVSDKMQHIQYLEKNA